MGKKWLVTSLVVFIYIFTSGLILAFAQGYTVDFTTQKVVTTGVLEVNSFPPDARVGFNGEILKDTTPLSITHTTAGNYSITLDLPGYQTMNIPAQIKAQLVTRFLEVPLWPEAKNWSEIEMSDSILAISALADTGFIMVHVPQELSWWHIKNDTLVKTLSLPITTNEFGICSEDGTVCLVVGDERTVLVDLIHQEYVLLNIVLNAFEVMEIFRFQSDYYLLNKMSTQVNLQKITQTGEVLPQMLMDNVSAFDLQEQDLWYVQNGYLYRRSLISGITQQITPTNVQTIDRLAVTDSYIAWHGVNGDVVLWNRKTTLIENTWQKAQIFLDNNQLLVISEAKVWHIDANGISFVGQAPSKVSFVSKYTQYSWLAGMENGNILIIMLSPLGMYSIQTQSLTTAVLPYQLVATAERNILRYHVYPHASWLQF